MNIISVKFDLFKKNDFIHAIQWTCEQVKVNFKNNISVINISYSHIPLSDNYEEILKECSKYAIIVVSSGNDNEDACNYTLASLNFVFTVGSIDYKFNKDEKSNWGKCVNIYVPGKNILVANHKSNYHSYYNSGSSYSAAKISALASMIIHKSYFILEPEKVKEIIYYLSYKNKIKNIPLGSSNNNFSITDNILDLIGLFF